MSSTAAAAPQLPGHAPVFPPANAPAPAVSQSLREIFSLGDFVKEVGNEKNLNDQKALIAAYDASVLALVGPNDLQKVMVYDKETRQKVERFFKKKSAWKKLARHFRINVVEAWHQVTILDNGNVIAEVRVRGIAPWGQEADELGACTTYETRFAYDKSKGWHDCLATAMTRASNRAISALIAAGEVSAEEVGAEDRGDDEQTEEQRIAIRTAALAKMTLDDALKVTLAGKPKAWGNNGGKPLADVSNATLTRALAFFKEKIAVEDKDFLAYQIRAISLVLEARGAAPNETPATSLKEQLDAAADKEDAKTLPFDNAGGVATTSATTATAPAAKKATRELPADVKEIKRWSTAEMQAKVIELLELPLFEGEIRIEYHRQLRDNPTHHQLVGMLTVLAERMAAPKVALDSRGNVGVLPGEYDEESDSDGDDGMSPAAHD
jgi:hypothetical protein